MSELSLLVKQMRHEASGVLSVTLTDAAGGELPAWEPGAHVDVTLPNGFVRQYSLCGDPADRSAYRIGVLRETEGRGGSRWIHQELRVGTLLDVSEPRNHFTFDGGSQVRFVAGGIGITPILPMIREAQSRGLDWHLTYGGRSRQSMAFLDELPADKVTLRPQDEFGHLDLAEALGAPGDGVTVFACGPMGLLDALEEHCRDWPSGALRMERFAAPSAHSAPDADENTGDIEVFAQRSGVELVVPEGESILDGLEKAGIFPGSSCREGICGSCEVKVLEGTPAHHDYVLTAEEKAEGNTMMICVSRAKSCRLVLDI